MIKGLSATEINFKRRCIISVLYSKSDCKKENIQVYLLRLGPVTVNAHSDCVPQGAVNPGHNPGFQLSVSDCWPHAPTFLPVGKSAWMCLLWPQVFKKGQEMKGNSSSVTLENYSALSASEHSSSLTIFSVTIFSLFLQQLPHLLDNTDHVLMCHLSLHFHSRLLFRVKVRHRYLYSLILSLS